MGILLGLRWAGSLLSWEPVALVQAWCWGFWMEGISLCAGLTRFGVPREVWNCLSYPLQCISSYFCAPHKCCNSSYWNPLHPQRHFHEQLFVQIIGVFEREQVVLEIPILPSCWPRNFFSKWTINFFILSLHLRYLDIHLTLWLFLMCSIYRAGNTVLNCS